jgi:hypothetical protein
VIVTGSIEKRRIPATIFMHEVLRAWLRTPIFHARSRANAESWIGSLFLYHGTSKQQRELERKVL